MEDIGSEYYSNGWEFALAYDWLFDHPSITPEKRAKIEGYLVANAKRALELLNDDGWELSPSMWHGRTKIANLAMIVALSLETAPEAEELRAGRSCRFFGDGCRALRLSEGWPEGYAYWLGNRSFPFALAVDCWRTATGEPGVAGIDLAEMIRRTDLWHVYGQGPDDRFLIYGDVFQGVRMDYFWRAQTMDYYARITGDPHLQAFAVNGHLKSPRPYYDQWRWAAALAFDPEGKMPKASTHTGRAGGAEGSAAVGPVRGRGVQPGDLPHGLEARRHAGVVQGGRRAGAPRALRRGHVHDLQGGAAGGAVGHVRRVRQRAPADVLRPVAWRRTARWC